MSYLLEQARKMAFNITSRFDHWKTPCVMKFQNTDYELFGLYVRHNTRFNEIGNRVSGVKASITFHSRELNRVGVQFINSGGVVNLRGAVITVADEFAERKYEVVSTIPDETLGLIVCELNLLNNNVLIVEP